MAKKDDELSVEKDEKKATYWEEKAENYTDQGLEFGK